MDAITHAFPADAFYVPPTEVMALEAAREERGHFNLIHVASGLKADFFLAGRDELHAFAFANARSYDIGKLGVRLAPPEYVIVRKLEFFREGRSEKHLRDIRSMLSISCDAIDADVLRDWIRRRGLGDLWEDLDSNL